MVDWCGTVLLTTPRLVVRAFRRSDLPRYAALNDDPEVMRYLEGVPLTRDESYELAEWAQECYAVQRLGMLAIERREDGAFLGTCGLHPQRWYPDDLELGWRLARRYWGHGYATEAASAWLEHGFTKLGLPRVISVADPPNRRSLAVMHRLGFVYDHSAELKEHGIRFQAVIHSITAEQWRRSAGREACPCAA
jgi:RimJ/RimL family protein N-acetyltransferase